MDASTFPAKATLRRVIERARDDAGRRLDDLTVLQNDPYRIDTPAGHRDAQWVTEHLDALYGTYRRAHLRGLHYAIVAAGNVQKPDGAIYRNTHDDWKWLGNTAVKAARWLGYIPFERIIDQRNAPPVIHRTSKVETRANILYGIDIDLPSVRDIQRSLSSPSRCGNSTCQKRRSKRERSARLDGARHSESIRPRSMH